MIITVSFVLAISIAVEKQRVGEWAEEKKKFQIQMIERRISCVSKRRSPCMQIKRYFKSISKRWKNFDGVSLARVDLFSADDHVRRMIHSSYNFSTFWRHIALLRQLTKPPESFSDLWDVISLIKCHMHHQPTQSARFITDNLWLYSV